MAPIHKIADAALERKIKEAHQRLVSATTPEAQLEAFEALQELVRKRSPEQIARMEKEMRLD